MNSRKFQYLSLAYRSEKKCIPECINSWRRTHTPTTRQPRVLLLLGPGASSLVLLPSSVPPLLKETNTGVGLNNSVGLTWAQDGGSLEAWRIPRNNKLASK